MTTKHHLKICDEKLHELMNCGKKAELRKNDRNYQLRDLLVFRHYGDGMDYKYRITHIETWPDALREEYVCLSLEFIVGERY